MTDLSGVAVLCGTTKTVVTPAQWSERVEELRGLLAGAGFTPEKIDDDLREAYGGITFRDASGASWRHDGRTWWRWGNDSWTSTLPPPQLILDRVELAIDPDDIVPAGEGSTWDDWAPPEDFVFDPTHLVPPCGADAWTSPDPTVAPAASLDPLLEVALLEQRPDGWAHVRCANGWEAWVDGTLLVPAPTPPALLPPPQV